MCELLAAWACSSAFGTIVPRWADKARRQFSWPLAPPEHLHATVLYVGFVSSPSQAYPALAPFPRSRLPAPGVLRRPAVSLQPIRALQQVSPCGCGLVGSRQLELEQQRVCRRASRLYAVRNCNEHELEVGWVQRRA